MWGCSSVPLPRATHSPVYFFVYFFTRSNRDTKSSKLPRKERSAISFCIWWRTAQKEVAFPLKSDDIRRGTQDAFAQVRISFHMFKEKHVGYRSKGAEEELFRVVNLLGQDKAWPSINKGKTSRLQGVISWILFVSQLKLLNHVLQQEER